MPNFLARLTELQHEAEQLASRFAAASDVGPVDGRDKSGAVQVRVAPDGRVIAVNLRANWREKIQYGGLADAVRHAIDAAQRERVLAFAGRAAEYRPPDPGQQPAPMPSGLTGGQGDPLSPTAENLRAGLLTLLDAAAREIEAASRARDARSSRMAEGSNSGRSVTVRVVSGGQVCEVEIDERPLRRARDGHAEQALRDAFDAAYRSLDEQLVNDASGTPALTELRGLLDDPHRLLGNLLGVS
jgi:DNA-binding protein YbaB